VIDLNVFVLPGNNGVWEPERAVNSFGSIVNRSFYMDTPHIPEGSRSDYFAYIYGHETVGAKLAEVLPVYLDHGFDFLTLFILLQSEEETRVIYRPRIFKRGTELNGVFPLRQGLNFTRVLDGWIYG
jgi:hypothetical protein